MVEEAEDCGGGRGLWRRPRMVEEAKEGGSWLEGKAGLIDARPMKSE